MLGRSIQENRHELKDWGKNSWASAIQGKGKCRSDEWDKILGCAKERKKKDWGSKLM